MNRISTENLELISEDRYVLRVGDLCFAAVGQIVNRPLHPASGGLRNQNGARDLRSACVNSPVHSPLLARATREDWAGLTPAAHAASLQIDARGYLAAKTDRTLDPGGLRRMLFYYPEQGAKLAEVLLVQLPDEKLSSYADQLIADITPFSWSGREAAVSAFALRLLAKPTPALGLRMARNDAALACRDLLSDRDRIETVDSAIAAERAAVIAERSRAMADAGYQIAGTSAHAFLVMRGDIADWLNKSEGPNAKL